MLIRELVDRVILEKLGGDKKVQDVLKILSSINEKIYIGQFYDLNVLHFDRLDLSITLDDYMGLYIERCYGLSGAFNEHIAELGGVLAEASTERLRALKEFGKNFGIALQIINDIADLVPPGTDGFIGREYQDQLSDVKNCRATLPIFHFLKFVTEGPLLLQSARETGDYKGLIGSLVKSGAIHYAKKTAREYASKAKRSLAIFEDSLAKNLLSIATSISTSNKYYVALRGFEHETQDKFKDRSEVYYLG